MKLNEGDVVIFQPKYKVPCIFDLNDRGTFATRPPVTHDWGFRIISDAKGQPYLQVAILLNQPGKDSQTGKPYDWMVKSLRIDLDEALVPDPENIAGQLAESDIRSALMADFNQWHDNFVPVLEKGKIDIAELKKKVAALVDEARTQTRKELVRRNQHWVLSNIPRRVHDFKYGLYNHVREKLYHEYQNIGGEDSEKNLIRKIALFNRVLENCNHEDLLKPDGSGWKNEDEIWQCWIGFAGSEPEAHRVCRTMDSVFRDLQL
ncbi:hypothetical protein [Desulfosarcina ovata]|uniref:Uncharacterized protein n=2 Tax=Desulfosarcina ovata TaxID=83564 RepID=A0A5K8AAL3_9BACT|nr:hypothetical protein [Desulfosarcina ovata]BBO82306.1 hypothetical protein DSCO28_28720 [Desulfosarcina ovata subsp. sediminis]BBO89518.1 hypothetical protein DSCOOX_26980 [Desulfosarcina ovata subsp. ovata]